MDWQSRIIGDGEADPQEIVDNPLNWRRHPDLQVKALAEALDKLGWIQRIVVNRRTGRLIDGHLRVEVARRRGEKRVPVLYVDLDEEEERLALATLDPLSALAETNVESLSELLNEIGDVGGELGNILADLSADAAVGDWPAEGRSGAEKVSAGSLAERYGVPPVSVLDARNGRWQSRKRLWLSLGIKGEAGREKMKARSGGMVAALPNYYDIKNETERKLGHEISNAEFERDYLPKYLTNAMASSSLAFTEGNGLLSVFDPVLTELIYRWFAPPGGRILDPFAGSSVRGIVAAMLGYEYVGVELRGEQVKANREQAREILPAGVTAPLWIEGDSREVLPTLEKGFDLVFSCPPYADLEKYSDDLRDISNMKYAEFLSAYNDIIRKAVDLLSLNRFAVFVVGEVRGKRGFYRGLIPATHNAFEGAGARYYNEAVLVTPIGSKRLVVSRQFASGRKLGKVHQNVLGFYKGDPDAIKHELGGTVVGVDWDAEEPSY